MKQKVRALLQKINFIEVDMDLQKQILRAIPSAERGEMEKVLVKIAEMKQQILDLREEIRNTDPEAHDRIVAIEQGTERFKALAAEKRFVQVKTPDEAGICFVTLNDGSRLDCLIAARDEDGHWTVLTLFGEIKAYPGGLVRD